jgi:2-polyprenyl-3-methyl-5-hydroxy-6-metoxy-1,4-benzoquinol methylase
MNQFVKVDAGFLQEIATDSDRIPSLYYSKNTYVRKFFWKRLECIGDLIEKHVDVKHECLDFGGGGGVFLPTLNQLFQKIVCIDLEVTEAKKVVQKYGLANVVLKQEDVREAELTEAPFSAIVVADVLEHFKVLEPAISKLSRWLADDGFLFVSLPTESFFYRGLRLLFGVPKPWDHYHKASEVEACLAQSGFQLVDKCYVPFARFPFLTLFNISVWKKAETLL